MTAPREPVRTTSWGGAWIEGLVLAHTFDGKEVSRGRGLAARDAVDEFSVEPASVGAVVRGRSALERRVRLGFRRFTDEQWATVRAELAASPRLVAAVLDGALPEALHDRLADLGCGLLPGVRDVSIDCTCGNLAESCVHAAAVCCHLADALDADPLLLVTLRGGDRGALVAGLVPASPERRTAASQRHHRSVIPGRPGDPGMAGSTAWRRRLEPLPDIDVRRRGPGRPRVGSVPPSAELGVDQTGLDRLVSDAAARAGALLAGSDTASTALELDVVADAVRRNSMSTLAAPGSSASVLAETGGFDAVLSPSVTAAWNRCGPAGVDVLLRPSRLTADEVALVEAAWEVPVKARSTGAVLPGGRQVRRAADGTWVVLAPDEELGWTIVDAGLDLDELAV